MIIEVDADERYWAQVPAGFPWGGYADAGEWVRGIQSRYRSVRPAAAADELEAVRALAQTALADLGPSAAFGLLFMPAPAPVGALVRVDVAHADANVDPRVQLLGSTPLSVEPDFVDLEVPGVGRGISARFLIAGPGEPTPAGIGYLIEASGGVVRLLAAPISTTMVGLIDQPLREVVDTLRIRA